MRWRVASSCDGGRPFHVLAVPRSWRLTWRGMVVRESRVCCCRGAGAVAGDQPVCGRPPLHGAGGAGRLLHRPRRRRHQQRALLASASPAQRQWAARWCGLRCMLDLRSLDWICYDIVLWSKVANLFEDKK